MNQRQHLLMLATAMSLTLPVHAKIVALSFQGFIDQLSGPSSTNLFLNNQVFGSVLMDTSATDLAPEDPLLGVYPGAQLTVSAGGSFSLVTPAYVFVDGPSGHLSVASSLEMGNDQSPPYVSLNLSYLGSGKDKIPDEATWYDVSGSLNILRMDPLHPTATAAATNVSVSPTAVPEAEVTTLFLGGFLVSMATLARRQISIQLKPYIL